MGEADHGQAIGGLGQSLTCPGGVIGGPPGAVDIRDHVKTVWEAAHLLTDILIIGRVVVDARTDDHGAVNAALFHGKDQLLDDAARFWVGDRWLIRPIGPGMAVAVDDHSGVSHLLALELDGSGLRREVSVTQRLGRQSGRSASLADVQTCAAPWQVGRPPAHNDVLALRRTKHR